MNIELFKKIRERIATIPQSYDQRTYYTPTTVAPCGTVCCLAGEAVICAAPTVEDGVNNLRSLSRGIATGTVATAAARLLGLISEDQNYFGLSDTHPARRLFSESPHQAWPEPFRSQWLNADDEQEAQIAVAYLDHIISTGKVLE